MATERNLAKQAVQWLGRWYVALAAALVLAGVVLFPGLGGPGLWEPQERQIADRHAPPLDAPAPPEAKPPAAQAASTSCTIAPKDAEARSLTRRAIAWGRDTIDDSDTGRRLPLALLGLVTALAAAGIAMRSGRPRAGVITAIVIVAMPLLTLQSRMLTSEIGTACGGALIVYGLVGLSTLARGLTLRLLDAALCAVAIAAGVVIGFYGGGALLGLVVPIGAVAAAGSLGVPMIVDAVKGRPALRHLPAVAATLVVVVLLALLAYQTYQLVVPYPGIQQPARQMLGVAIIPDGCYSSALGGIWRHDDDLRYIFDSTFEQIAYGTYPWGIVGPIAMFSLMRSRDQRARMIGAVTFAWAGAAWIACEAFQRKVGFTVWPGFPALAIAIGVWVERLLSRGATDDDELPGGLMLVGLFVGLAMIDFGNDLQSFTDKLTSLFTGSDTIVYPKDASFVVLLRRWVLAFGLLVAVGLAVGFGVWRTGATAFARRMRATGTLLIAGALAVTFALAAFWSFVWQPTLSLHLSSKSLLETVDELRHPGDSLVIMGDLGQAPRSYTDIKPEQVPSRAEVVAALKRPNRVFALAPQSELCALHREMGDKGYYVLEDRNARSLLISNRVDGAEDQNPLASMIRHQPPETVRYKPKGRVVWDNKIELVGWDLPQKIRRGDSFEVVTYFKILAPVGGSWTMLMHFDGPLRLRDGDHKPIKDRCPTSTWQQGDYIIDRHTMQTGGGGFPAGRYDLWIGFFTGSAPNFRNMPVSAAPGDMRDTVDRVKITSISLE
ncbi:MAG TPA: hypothetical protein VFQ53_28995 [Kofleriaceae bacterium]|nr:hypothetical protein [Kofleriaceae bacterium]